MARGFKIKREGRDELFAAMPAMEAKKAHSSQAREAAESEHC